MKDTQFDCMARREYKTINGRLQRGRTLSAKEGKYVGNTHRMDTAGSSLRSEKHTLEPKPDEARDAKLIYKWYTIGNCRKMELMKD